MSFLRTSCVAENLRRNPVPSAIVSSLSPLYLVHPSHLPVYSLPDKLSREHHSQSPTYQTLLLTSISYSRLRAMGLVTQLYQRLSRKKMPSIENLSKMQPPPRLAFLQRRIRLKGNSSISVPLGIVLLFPVTVVLLIFVLFIRHPDSPTRILIPSGSPPSIR